MKHTFLKNLILFIVGFCMYITVEVLFRGYSYKLMGLLGSLALIIIGAINDDISWDMPLFYQMCIGGVIVTVLEYIVGIADKYWLHIGMWDYSDIPFNIQGAICLPFTLAWVGLSFVAIIVDDAIKYYVMHGDVRPYYRSICGKILFWMPERECGK